MGTVNDAANKTNSTEAATASSGPTSSSTAATADNRRGPGNGPDRRLNRVDRRTGLDRRKATAEQAAAYTGPERRSGVERRVDTGLERRRGPGRRLSDDRRTAEEGEMTEAQFEFVKAVETYKKVNRKLYPTWTEILEVLLQLGYRKVEAREIYLENVPEAPLHKAA